MLHRCFALLLLFVIVIPITIQAVHALEKHEHTVCNAVDVKHIHSQDIDCDFFHFQIQQDTVALASNFENSTIQHATEILDNYLPSDYQLHLTSKSSRAPPYFIVY